VVSTSLTELIQERPGGADPAIVNDLPNEFGIPNHDPDGTGDVDNHDMVTGSAEDGTVFSSDPADTCQDWTATGAGSPRCGHTWPAGGVGGGMTGGGIDVGGDFGGMGSMAHWISALNESGCDPFDPQSDLVESGPPMPNNPSIGSGGGYGGFYCFAL
jgi:hypothetical protein